MGKKIFYITYFIVEFVSKKVCRNAEMPVDEFLVVFFVRQTNADRSFKTVYWDYGHRPGISTVQIFSDNLKKC